MSARTSIADLSAQRQALEQIRAQPNRALQEAARQANSYVKKIRSKYGNVRTVYKSIQGFERTYDSKGEADYAAMLDKGIQTDLIKWWLPQVRIPLPGGVVYVADFLVQGDDGIRFVDFKGKDTQASKNKRKQVKACFGIDVEIARRA